MSKTIEMLQNLADAARSAAHGAQETHAAVFNAIAELAEYGLSKEKDHEFEGEAPTNPGFAA